MANARGIALRPGTRPRRAPARNTRPEKRRGRRSSGKVATDQYDEAELHDQQRREEEPVATEGEQCDAARPARRNGRSTPLDTKRLAMVRAVARKSGHTRECPSP